MKFPIFLTLIIILFATAFVPVTEGYHAKVFKNVAGFCKIWVTDIDGNYVAGNKNYHRCDDSLILDIDTGSDEPYHLNAHVEASAKKTKHRGPFVRDTCYSIFGYTTNWRFDQKDQCNR